MPTRSTASSRIKARRAIRSKGKGNMKKTTKRGAYKRNRVKTMVNRRNPMVENKKRELANIVIGTEIQDPTVFNPLMSGETGAVDSTGIFSILPLTNYTTQFQVGMRNDVDSSDRISGSNVFGKYLNAKGICRFPVGSNIPQFPQNLELIWGWCPAYNRTTNTAPAIGNVTPADITIHIIAQVAEFINAQSDQLRYIQKRDQHIQILGRKKIRPNLNQQYSAPAASGAVYPSGVAPDVKWSVNWPLMKKIHYDYGGTISNTGATYTERCFNLNDDRLPFLCFYQPDTGTLLSQTNSDYFPHVAYNSCFYFTDS